MRYATFTSILTGMAFLAGMGMTDDVSAGSRKQKGNIRVDNVIEGTDLNSKENPTVQPQDPALAGNGIDQTMQFGDVLRGTRKDDLMIGKLGPDLFWGGDGDDVMIGGTEDFNPSNRDRAFGGSGQDIFMWAPGDGSDLFEGGRGHDAVMLGKIGEQDESGNTVFRVDAPGVSSDAQDFDPIFLNPSTGLPLVDVSGSPGFCEIIDESNAEGGKAALDALGIDHLVKFFVRALADTFASGAQTTNNGLAVTLHLKDVETVVCTNREGGLIQAYDLTHVPAKPIDLNDISNGKLRNRIKAIAF